MKTTEDDINNKVKQKPGLTQLPDAHQVADILHFFFIATPTDKTQQSSSQSSVKNGAHPWRYEQYPSILPDLPKISRGRQAFFVKLLVSSASYHKKMPFARTGTSDFEEIFGKKPCGFLTDFFMPL
ncbi:MAG: hypothetical protein Q4D38_08415 [Planctomycetia bacterium]|nr:hypothetical protein [Planctomycetia bacterium]